jgi:hypothetical protein
MLVVLLTKKLIVGVDGLPLGETGSSSLPHWKRNNAARGMNILTERFIGRSLLLANDRVMEAPLTCGVTQGRPGAADTLQTCRIAPRLVNRRAKRFVPRAACFTPNQRCSALRQPAGAVSRTCRRNFLILLM